MSMVIDITSNAKEPDVDSYSFSDVHKAVITNSPRQLLKLFQTYTDVNQKDENGFTPLHLAVSLGRLDLVKFLIRECQANINIKTQTGLSSVHLAVLHNQKSEILQYLINSGCDINTVDKNECTPLHLAVKTKATQSIIILLGAGCLHNTLDKKGRTPKDVAIESRNPEIVDIFHEHEETLSQKTEDRFSSLKSRVPRQRFDFHPHLSKRSSSLLSCTSPLKPIFEDGTNSASDSEQGLFEYESDVSETSGTYSDHCGSVDSVFVKSLPLQESGTENNNIENFDLLHRPQTSVSIDGISSKESLEKIVNSYNFQPSNCLGRMGKKRKPIRRTKSHEITSSTVSMDMNLPYDGGKKESRSDLIDLSRQWGMNGIKDEGKSEVNRTGDAINSIIRNEREKFSLSERMNDLYCLDVEDVKVPRARKFASTEFKINNENKDDIDCDEEILSLLKTGKCF